MKARRIEDVVFQHLSGRWALQILLALRNGPLRFIDLRRAIPGVSANTLTTRLRELEAMHFVERRQLPPPTSIQVYDLGQLGRGLQSTLQHLANWKADLSLTCSNRDR